MKVEPPTFMDRGFAKRLLSRRRSHKMAAVETDIQTVHGNGFVWTDVQGPQRDDIEELAARFGFHSLNVEDCMAKFELPKLDIYNDHFFVILSLPPLAGNGALGYSQLSMFVGKDFLVTVHQGDLQPLNELVSAGQKGNMTESLGQLVHEIVDVLVDDLMHMSRKIIANLEDLEDQVFDDTRSVARDISLLRRDINKLRRMVNPLRKLVEGIAVNIKKVDPETSLELYFDDVLDHVDKVLETLEESQETMEIYKDTDFTLSTEKTNKVLAMLTIIFTLAIPSTVIGTFFGMNVALPGVGGDSDHTAFAIILVASAVPAGVMAAYFKRLGWM